VYLYLLEGNVADPIPDVLMPLLAAYHAGEKLLLLFDYDGTLTPIVEHPWQAQLAPRTRAVLAGLAAQPHIHVGVFSGRRLDELEQLIGLPQLAYCGVSGTEIRIGGNLQVHPTARDSVQLIDEITRRLSAIEHVYPGAWVEHKRYGFTVHFRGVDPTLIEEVHKRILGFLSSWSQQLRIVDAPLAVEVLIGGTWTKGDAVRKMIEYVGEPLFAFYAGDAPNDQEALEAVTAHGGLALGVGPLAPPAATAHVADPDTLVRWMEALLHALQGAPAGFL
jgi:trehalose 6-phosphate phosphatase